MEELYEKEPHLDPLIGNAHRQAHVKADASLFHWTAHARQTGNFFTDGDHEVRIITPEYRVRQLKVCRGLRVNPQPEVLRVAAAK